MISSSVDETTPNPQPEAEPRHRASAEGNQRGSRSARSVGIRNIKWTVSSVGALVIAVVATLALLLLAIPASREIGSTVYTMLAMVLLVVYVHQGWFRPLEEMSCLPKTRHERTNSSSSPPRRTSTCAKKTAMRLLLVVLILMNISTYPLEGVLTTTNNADPHPFQNFVANLLGSTFFMLISLWFVDGFFLVLRIGLWVTGQTRRCRSKNEENTTKEKTDEENNSNHSEGDEQQQPRDTFRRISPEEQERGIELDMTEWLAAKQQKLRFPFTVGLYVILLTTSLAAGLRAPRTQRVDIVMSHLPTCLDGFTMGILADIHAGPTVGRSEIAQHVARMNTLAPDVILIAGDLVDGVVADIASLVDPIQDLQASYGVYYSVGNHEHYYQPDEWRQWANETAGLTVLHNTMTRIVYNNTKNKNTDCILELAGVDDAEGSPDYAAAFSNHTPGLPLVLIAHQPVQVLDTQISQNTDLDLILAGHTHGGQMWPLHSFATMTQKYIAGLYRFDQGGDSAEVQEGTGARWQHLYVTQGVVGWGPRMRFGARTEYSLLTLRSPEVVGTTNRNKRHADGASRGALAASMLGWICIGITALLVLCMIIQNLPCCKQQNRSQTSNQAKSEDQQVSSVHPEPLNDTLNDTHVDETSA